MAKKTKKEKIEAEKRRERFLYSLKEPERGEISQKGKEDHPLNGGSQKKDEPQRTIENQDIGENFAYLKKDLLKITLLATFLFGIQILLYLTIFARL